MFQKNLRLAYLLDFYGDILDDHTKSVMLSYYEDDLSLSEIAETIGISRQGVRHIIKKAEEELDFFETKLGLALQFKKIEEALEQLNEVADSLSAFSDPRMIEYAAKVRQAVETISTNKD